MGVQHLLRFSEFGRQRPAAAGQQALHRPGRYPQGLGDFLDRQFHQVV
jgi:hypothetical protein